MLLNFLTLILAISQPSNFRCCLNESDQLFPTETKEGKLLKKKLTIFRFNDGQ